jgi:hypothetical protein
VEVSRYALDEGRTVSLHRITEPSTNPVFADNTGVVSFVEVDPETGIAYTVQWGEPLQVDELSPWKRGKR